MSNFINNYFHDNNIYHQEKRPNTISKNKTTKKDLKNYNKVKTVADDIQHLKNKREERNRHMEDEKFYKKNVSNFIPKLDEEFNFLIQKKKLQIEYQKPRPYKTSQNTKIFVCVRKRPIFPKEIMDGEIDCVSAINPKIYIYESKIKIDGYTKYIDVNEFNFDNAFNEEDNTYLLYKYSILPSLDILSRGGVVTCFAYGQTGSGKTYTMRGIQDFAIENIFQIFSELGKKMKTKFIFYISFFEIYLGLLYDLLNNRNKVMALEDKNQRVQIYGLIEQQVESPKEMKSIIDFANRVRTTHNTVTNETSSRSHAICNFIIKIQNQNYEKEYAKLSLVDLAGSERATETQSNDKNRLAEGAEINKSLLALKECIRALDARKAKGNNEHHVPFRNSKLTLVLRDSFLGKDDLCRIIMISCISPSNHSANHTINTLRYSMRLKEKVPSSANSNIRRQMDNKKLVKNKVINLNKNKKFSKSPNIKRNISKKKEKFHILEKKNNNNLHHSNGNINNYSAEMSQNLFFKKQNSSLITIKKGEDKKNMTRHKSPNYKNKIIGNYFGKKNTNSKKLISNMTQKPLIINKKKDNQKYSSTLNNKKKELQRAQTSSNKFNKTNVSKKRRVIDLKDNKKPNNSMMSNQIKQPIKYYQSYNSNNHVKNEFNLYDSMKYNNQIKPNNQNKDANIDVDPGIINKELISGQIDVMKSQQKYLTEDGNLINKFKGLTKDNANKQIYTPVIENIIQSKMNYLNKLQDNIIEYKKLLYNYKE